MTFKVHSAEELRGHALELARAFGISCQEVDGMPVDQAALVWGVAFFPPIVSDETYVVALHEMGHRAAALGNGLVRDHGDINMMVVQEEAAWDWAYEKATQFGVWTAAMEAVRAGALETYHKEQREALAARAAAVLRRAGRPSEKIGSFMGRGHGEAPPPKPRPRPGFRRNESVAAFMKRRTK